jgi:hypothetical protein
LIKDKENEMTSEGKLIYCHFGDIPAVAIIMQLHGFKTRNKHASLVGNNDKGSHCWLWEGALTIGAGESVSRVPMAIAMIKPEADNEAFLRDELGFAPENRLLVKGSATPDRVGSVRVMRFLRGEKNTVYLRNLNRWPLLDYERMAAVQIVDTFLVNHRQFRKDVGQRIYQRPVHVSRKLLYLVAQ